MPHDATQTQPAPEPLKAPRPTLLSSRPDPHEFTCWADLLYWALSQRRLSTTEYRQLLSLLGRLRGGETLGVQEIKTSINVHIRLDLEQRGWLTMFFNPISRRQTAALSIPPEHQSTFERLSRAISAEKPEEPQQL